MHSRPTSLLVCRLHAIIIESVVGKFIPANCKIAAGIDRVIHYYLLLKEAVVRELITEFGIKEFHFGITSKKKEACMHDIEVCKARAAEEGGKCGGSL